MSGKNGNSEAMATAEVRPSVDESAATSPSTGADTDYKYQLEERVLCYHGPLIYEAKCLKRRTNDKRVQYFIHYNGWNKNWDEWVDESRILQMNPLNLKLQHDLKSKHNKPAVAVTAKNKRKISSQNMEGALKEGNGSQNKILKSDAKDGSGGDDKEEKKKKKSLVPLFVESEEAFNSKQEIRIKIPEELKPFLVDDWDLITRQQKLFELPAKVSVAMIVDEYVKQKLATKLSSVKESQMTEVMNGIKEYFNAMLGSQLLYRFERLQYQELLQKNSDRKMCELYGSVHLLRLFTKFGHFLAFTALNKETIQCLLMHFNDFLKWFARNSFLYFNSTDYSVASPEYLRQTM